MYSFTPHLLNNLCKSRLTEIRRVNCQLLKTWQLFYHYSQMQCSNQTSRAYELKYIFICKKHGNKRKMVAI